MLSISCQNKHKWIRNKKYLQTTGGGMNNKHIIFETTAKNETFDEPATFIGVLCCNHKLE